MKIFLTVGTTRFDSLMEFVAKAPYFKAHDCILQVGPSGKKMANFECFDYVSNIDHYYEWADVVVTHAGAGSIYRLLSMRKRIVIVPNSDRLDHHQFDIARYMSSNNFALATSTYSELPAAIDAAATKEFALFHRDSFYAAENILTLIQE